MAEGIIETGIFYISADDEKPLQALKAVLTFSQQIEVANMSENSLFEVWPEVEQVSVMMLDTEEVEVEQKLAQVQNELLQKDNDTYRRQHSVFS